MVYFHIKHQPAGSTLAPSTLAIFFTFIEAPMLLLSCGTPHSRAFANNFKPSQPLQWGFKSYRSKCDQFGLTEALVYLIFFIQSLNFAKRVSKGWLCMCVAKLWCKGNKAQLCLWRPMQKHLIGSFQLTVELFMKGWGSQRGECNCFSYGSIHKNNFF